MYTFCMTGCKPTAAYEQVFLQVPNVNIPFKSGKKEKHVFRSSKSVVEFPLKNRSGIGVFNISVLKHFNLSFFHLRIYY